MAGVVTSEEIPWKEPVPAEDLPKLFHRERGQFVDKKWFEIKVRPEPYEKRLLRLFLLARKNRADELTREGNPLAAAPLYESIFKLDPWMEEEPTAVLPLATIYVALKKYDQAEAWFKKSLSLDLTRDKRAEVYYFLAALCGDRPEGAQWKEKALQSPDLAPQLRARLEQR